MLRFPARRVGDTKVSSGICIGRMHWRFSVPDGFFVALAKDG